MAKVVETPQSACLFGLARGDITPPVGIYHRMWGAAAHDRATEVHRPLTATAFLIGPRDDPSAALFIVALDHCILFEPDASRLLATIAAKTDIDRQRILIAFSHTHSAGLMDSSRINLPGGELIVPYLDRLGERLTELVAEARSRAAARRTWLWFGAVRTGRASRLLRRGQRPDRRRVQPRRTADDTVMVVRVTDEDVGLLATLVNYACHPTTLAWQNTLISPDFPGAMRDVVERETGVPCVFLQGASGDLGPRDGFVGDPEVADRNGRQLGYAAMSALEGLPPPRTQFEFNRVVESGTAIGTWRHAPLRATRLNDTAVWRQCHWSIDLPYRSDLPTVEGLRKERTHLEQERLSAIARNDEDKTTECRAFIERIDRQLVRILHLPPGPTYPFTIDLWQVGDAVWLAVEAEPYQHLQVELRRRFPAKPIVVMTVVNGGRPVYLPTTSTYGRGIYQDRIAVLAPGCLERLTEAIATQIGTWSS